MDEESDQQIKKTLTPSPKKTISGFTYPPHTSHFAIFLASICSFIFLSSKGRLQSIHLCVAKLPCASMTLSFGTPARRSSVSMFCVKQVWRRDCSASRRTNECVNVGRNFPGYSS